MHYTSLSALHLSLLLYVAANKTPREIAAATGRALAEVMEALAEATARLRADDFVEAANVAKELGLINSRMPDGS